MFEKFYDPQLGHLRAIIRLSDGATIPLDEGNADYQKYLRWEQDPSAPEFTEGTLGTESAGN